MESSKSSKIVRIYKVAVLVNEFGDINIDGQLLVGIEDGMVELSNGCICCTINDSLVDAVYNVLERQEQIDYMVIETTGVADRLDLFGNRTKTSHAPRFHPYRDRCGDIYCRSFW